MNSKLDHLLEHYRHLTGRGNMVTANETMITIVQELADMYKPCQCSCGNLPPLSRPAEPSPEERFFATKLSECTPAADDLHLTPEGIEDPSMIEPEPTKPRRGRPPKLRSV